MAKLHEVLAVEADLEGKYKKVCEETTKTFKDRPTHFLGSVRTQEMFKDDGISYPPEYLDMGTTVNKKLLYTWKSISPYFKALLQKEKTNQEAKADLVVNGVVLMENLPATFLLGMETRLKHVRNVYDHIPTLPIGIEWKHDPTRGKDVYITANPDEKLKTERQFKSQILVQPTDHHPAQIEKWEEQVAIGRFVKHTWSGMLSSADKSRNLENIDILIRAFKQARQRANAQEIVKADKDIGEILFNFIVSK